MVTPITNTRVIALFEDIQNDIKKKEIQQSEIAKTLKIKESSLTYYLQCKNRMRFIKFVELLNLIYEEEDILKKKRLIIEFVETTDKKENLRECLEWSIHNGDKEIFEVSINKGRIENYSDETTRVYELSMNRSKNKIDNGTLYEIIEGYKFEGIPIEKVGKKGKKTKYEPIKQIENKAFLSILTLYVHLDLREYATLERLSNSVLKRIEMLNTGFIKDSYKVRTQEMVAISLMKNGHIEEARKFSLQLTNEINLNLYPIVVNSLYSLLAELYVFEDYNKSLYYIEKAISMFKRFNLESYEKRKKMLQATHDFIKIINNDFTGLYLSDEAEKAHYYARISKRKEALDILKKIKKSNNTLSAHQLYYKALCTGEEEDFRKAGVEFSRTNDVYYSILPEKYRFSLGN